jgi:predicted NodU family carbamoyl transferase
MAYASLGKVQPVLLELVSTFFETWHREHYYQLCGMHAADLREIIAEAIRNTSGTTLASPLSDGRAAERSGPEALEKLLVGGEAGADLAATIQAAFEGLAVSTVQHLLRMHKRTVDGIVLVGGCALNVRANQRVADVAALSALPVYVPAAPNDAGIVVGAVWALSPPSAPPAGRPQRLQYSGPHLFDRHELQAVASRRDAHPADLHLVASWLGHGHVIGMIRGRTEWGPRALGHRSLLG